MTPEEKFEQVIRAIRLIERISTDQAFPASMRNRAAGILLTLNVTRDGVTQVADLILDDNANIDNRLEALDVFGQLVQKGLN